LNIVNNYFKILPRLSSIPFGLDIHGQSEKAIQKFTASFKHPIWVRYPRSIREGYVWD